MGHLETKNWTCQQVINWLFQKYRKMHMLVGIVNALCDMMQKHAKFFKE